MTIDTPDILKKITARKVEDVAVRKADTPLPALRDTAETAGPTRGFVDAIRASIDAGRAAVIAECKKASPSKGVLREEYDPAAIAAAYARGGATCLSVLTDMEFFQGADQHLVAARESCDLPVLRKDFVVDAYQVYESRVLGADCILLIVACLDDAQLQEFADLAMELGLDILLEVHTREELERAMRLRTPLIGINNRDLHTFKTDINTTIALKVDVFYDRIVVTESGIHKREDVDLMRRNGVNSFLVGEAFMKAPDPGAQLQALFFS